MNKRKEVIVNKYLKIVMNAAKKADLFITGDIVDDAWYEDDVTPQAVQAALESFGDIKTLNMHINSYGGSTNAGNFLFNILKEYKTANKVKIIAYITSAYSMATGVAMVADTVYIYANGIFMIHKPLTETYGNADDFRQTAEILDVVEESLISNYMTRFNGTVDELKELLAKESYLSPADAVKYGFADEVLEPVKVKNAVDGVHFGNVLFKQKEFVNIIRQQNKLAESEETHEMKYHKILGEKYGVSEESFNEIEDAAALMQFINARTEADTLLAVNKAREEMQKEVIVPFIENKDNFLAALSVEDITEQEIVDLAVKGKAIDPDIQDKAAKYDAVYAENKKIMAARIEDALVVGRRAMGAENFNSDVFKSVLSKMNYDEIITLEKSWEQQAKAVLNAGKQASQTQDKFAKSKDDDVCKMNTNF